MKRSTLWLIGVALGVFVMSATVSAQSSGTAPGVNVAMAKLFGANNAFTSKVDIQVLDSTQKEAMRMPMLFATVDGRMRVEIDMMQVKSKSLPPDALAAFKQAGVDRVVSVIRPDKKAKYLIYMGARSLVNEPMSEEETAAAGGSFKMEKTPLGTETIDGHPCTKQRVVIKNSKDAVVLDAVTWNASDLKDFPVQISVKEEENTSILLFRDLKFKAPD